MTTKPHDLAKLEALNDTLRHRVTALMQEVRELSGGIGDKCRLIEKLEVIIFAMSQRRQDERGQAGQIGGEG